jgi:hypothetical protein
MLDVHEHTFVVTYGIKGMKFSGVRERFSRRFNKSGLADNTIRVLANKFRRTGYVHDENRCCHPKGST